jgi:archaeosortase A
MKKQDQIIIFLFFLIPTLMVIVGLVFFPYDEKQTLVDLISVAPLFPSLVFLLGGFLKPGNNVGKKLKIFGWILFSFFWATQINTLYSKEQDLANAAICIIGIYILIYLAYHEYLNLKNKKQNSCLNWAAGAAAIAGLIYFTLDLTVLAYWLREIVAYQSGLLLNLFIGGVEVHGVEIYQNGSYIVTIIFACTAVQSMVLFIGMILPLQNVEWKRKIYALIVTVIPIYFLNLIRNASIAYMIKDDPDIFFIAHNVIGKGGSLIALIVLLFIVIKIIPELFDNILCLTDLPKENGPVEKLGKKIFLTGRKK